MSSVSSSNSSSRTSTSSMASITNSGGQGMPIHPLLPPKDLVEQMYRDMRRSDGCFKHPLSRDVSSSSSSQQHPTLENLVASGIYANAGVSSQPQQQQQPPFLSARSAWSRSILQSYMKSLPEQPLKAASSNEDYGYGPQSSDLDDNDSLSDSAASPQRQSQHQSDSTSLPSAHEQDRMKRRRRRFQRRNSKTPAMLMALSASLVQLEEDDEQVRAATAARSQLGMYHSKNKRKSFLEDVTESTMDVSDSSSVEHEAAIVSSSSLAATSPLPGRRMVRATTPTPPAVRSTTPTPPAVRIASNLRDSSSLLQPFSTLSCQSANVVEDPWTESLQMAEELVSYLQK
jgi:hypothetical protein